LKDDLPESYPARPSRIKATTIAAFPSGFTSFVVAASTNKVPKSDVKKYHRHEQEQCRYEKETSSVEFVILGRASEKVPAINDFAEDKYYQESDCVCYCS